MILLIIEISQSQQSRYAYIYRNTYISLRRDQELSTLDISLSLFFICYFISSCFFHGPLGRTECISLDIKAEVERMRIK